MEIWWQWLEPNALELHLGKMWRWDIFDRAIWKLFATVERGQAPVTLVLNLNGLAAVPDAAIDQVMQAFSQSPDKLARVILVSQKPELRHVFALHPLFTPVASLTDVQIA